MKVKSDHRSKFSNLSNWKEEAWKKSGLQRDSNPWPPRYRCDVYQLSYEATHWERGQFIEFISSRAVKWCEAEGRQPIRSDNFRAKYRRKRDRVTLCCCCWVHGGLRLQKPVKWRNTQDQEENANDFCRLCGVNLKIKFGALLWLISIARYLLLRDKIRRLLWTCFLLAFFIVTPRLAMIRTVCKYSR